MTIKTREVFETRGRQFDSLEKAQQHRADLVGAFLDKAPAVLHPRERIAIADYLTANRDALRDLLDY